MAGAKKEIEKEASERTVYEVGYHIVPSVGEERVPEEVSKIKGVIETHGGIFIMEEYPVLVSLLYPISIARGGKREEHGTGYFGWVKFELTPTELETVKEELDENEHLMRYLLIKTVREDTRAPKRVFQKQEAAPLRTPSRSAEKAPKTAISEEELDRSIAQLVAE